MARVIFSTGGKWIVYANGWIALAALLLSWQTEWLITGQVQPDPLDGLIAFGAWALYLLHNLVSLNRQEVQAITSERWTFLRHHQKQLHFVLPVLVLFTGFWWMFLPKHMKLAVVAPALIALLYALPLLKGRKRLRDLPIIKVFLVGIVWSWVTVWLPAKAAGLQTQIPVWLMLAERFCCCFALAMAFDVRDAARDRNTLVAMIGPRRSVYLAMAVLLFTVFSVWLNMAIDAYSRTTFVAFLLSVAAMLAGIYRTLQPRSDWYYSFILDGLLVVQPLLVMGLSLIS